MSEILIKIIRKLIKNPKLIWCDIRGFPIYLAGFEFKSKHIFLVRA